MSFYIELILLKTSVFTQYTQDFPPVTCSFQKDHSLCLHGNKPLLNLSTSGRSLIYWGLDIIAMTKQLRYILCKSFRNRNIDSKWGLIKSSIDIINILEYKKSSNRQLKTHFCV